MIDSANRAGYAGASVSVVIAAAGVSRPTFYDYFEDREDCFLATVTDVHSNLLSQLEEALRDVSPEQATEAAIGALVTFAVNDPPAARFLMAESTSGGAAALALRDDGIARLAEALETACEGAANDARLVDLDARLVIGAVYRTLARRLRRAETALKATADELGAWCGSYARPATERRWTTLRPGRRPARSRHVPKLPTQEMPDPIPAGRPRLSGSEVAENHRRRILYAVAKLAAEEGYAAMTVADITRAAGVDGRVFYRLFSDKEDAFAAAHELGFQQVMDATSKAFFAARSWPERCWEAGQALTGLLQENPMVAVAGFVEAYSAGPAAVQRIENIHAAFLFFMQEGLMQSPGAANVSRTGMEAIVDAIFEVIYLQARQGEKLKVAAMLGPIAHVWLTPFMGVTAADAFIDAQGSGRNPRGR
ncbi:MAG TPA: TetR/AcrR family transcriptional regulator [Solirubrobacteraceae bacterium]|nr:TetR/AcrR family transcriptional regulator [Solirubrobacteraceae bacterium]